MYVLHNLIISDYWESAVFLVEQSHIEKLQEITSLMLIITSIYVFSVPQSARQPETLLLDPTDRISPTPQHLLYVTGVLGVDDAQVFKINIFFS